MRRTRSKSGVGGFGILAWLITIPAVVIILLLLTFAFYEVRKAYWDSKVREACERDGGVRIFERVHISKTDLDVLGRNEGKIAVPVKELASVNAPLYSVSTSHRLKEWNPEVRRVETLVIRRDDQKIVARWIYYSRIGGDFPTFAHPSSRGCPELRRITSDLQHLFIVGGTSR